MLGARPTASRPAGLRAPATWDPAPGKFVYTGATRRLPAVIEYLQQAGRREAARPGELHPDRRRGPAEVRDRQVVRDQHATRSPWSTTTARTSRRPARRPSREDPGADRPGGRDHDARHPAGERHHDLQKARDSEELRRDDAVRRLALVLRRGPGVRQVGRRGHHVHQGRRRQRTARARTSTARAQPDAAPRSCRRTSASSTACSPTAAARPGQVAPSPTEEKEFQEAMNARASSPRWRPPAPLTDDEREQVTLWETAAEGPRRPSRPLQFILGQRPLQRVGRVRQGARRRRTRAVIDVVNKAYERSRRTTAEQVRPGSPADGGPATGRTMRTSRVPANPWRLRRLAALRRHRPPRSRPAPRLPGLAGPRPARDRLPVHPRARPAQRRDGHPPAVRAPGRPAGPARVHLPRPGASTPTWSSASSPSSSSGFMPSGLASGEQTVFWWRGNVTPPRSLDRSGPTWCGPP